MRQWAVTVPKRIKWSLYARELDAAAAGAVLNFRVRGRPKNIRSGDICYIVHDGRVRGFHVISGVSYMDEFECSTSGASWRAGWYIQRTGKFYACDFPMVGFRGYREVSLMSPVEIKKAIDGDWGSE